MTIMTVSVAVYISVVSTTDETDKKAVALFLFLFERERDGVISCGGTPVLKVVGERSIPPNRDIHLGVLFIRILRLRLKIIVSSYMKLRMEMEHLDFRL